MRRWPFGDPTTEHVHDCLTLQVCWDPEIQTRIRRHDEITYIRFHGQCHSKYEWKGSRVAVS